MPAQNISAGSAAVAAGAEPQPVTAASYRQTLGLFATGVTVITARDPATGEVHGMTANGFMSVSLEPPLIVVSVRTGARLHAKLEAAGRYGVSLLGAALEREARRFAGAQIPEHEPGPEFELHEAAAVLVHSIGWLVADVVNAHRAGDHTLFIGQVTELAVVDPEQEPLGFFRGRYAHVTPMQTAVAPPLEPWHGVDAWG